MKNLLHLPKDKANFSKIIGGIGEGWEGDFPLQNLRLFFQVYSLGRSHGVVET